MPPTSLRQVSRVYCMTRFSWKQLCRVPWWSAGKNKSRFCPVVGGVSLQQHLLLASIHLISLDPVTLPRWRHFNRPMCTHDRSQFCKKKGVHVFWKYVREHKCTEFFQKGVLLDVLVIYTKRVCIFLWFARMWNPRNLTIPRLIFSRITQVLDIVDWFCGLFCPKYSKTLSSG